jgi:hypothetical protein
MFATVATLFFVPAVFSLLHGLRKPSVPEAVQKTHLAPVHQ